MALTFTDQTLNSGSLVKKVHINELIADHDAVKNAVSFSNAYTTTISNDSTATNIPKKTSLEQLRTAINNLETRFSANCNCLTNTNCCQTCQGCQSCQSIPCQSKTCQSCQSSSCQTCEGCVSCQACQTESCQSCQTK